MIPTSEVLIFSMALLCIGVLGVLTRRNAIVILMSIEMILNAANINFIAFSQTLNNLVGQIFGVFVIVVAAAEAAVGLAIVIALYRNRGTINVDEINLMKW
ncbi:MAG: NADH-quinone oxidoreductase subunit NuoK [Acidobacteriota bacterium]|nr:NADH-quinone oxidoreductase subunit NuoK [Acidobacteriota bacterium]